MTEINFLNFRTVPYYMYNRAANLANPWLIKGPFLQSQTSWRSVSLTATPSWTMKRTLRSAIRSLRPVSSHPSTASWYWSIDVRITAKRWPRQRTCANTSMQHQKTFPWGENSGYCHRWGREGGREREREREGEREFVCLCYYHHSPFPLSQLTLSRLHC